ncbi:MAG: M23 family metallopeptidase [Burkholderiales bacterium]
MNVILVSGRLARARTLTLTLPQVAAAAAAVMLGLILVAGALQYLMLRYASSIDSPFLNGLIVSASREQTEKSQTYLRENLNAMATKLGQMQAQLLRLDTLGERLAKTAGFKPQEFLFDKEPARGGAVSTLPSYDLSLTDLARQVEGLAKQVEDRSEKLGLLDALITFDTARKKLTPSMLPVDGGWYSSNFGWRIDPFNGMKAFHEGVDFMAETGTPVFAAAGGVVIVADFHPQYGNMIEIDHGNELVTRYAHASKRMVKVGDVVLAGAKIGEVGATGRATGSHLHFEVRHRGAPQNPARFLRLPG